MAERNYSMVYTIVKQEKSGKDFWQRVGLAFTNRDGSIYIKLNALPVNGSLYIKKTDGDNGGSDEQKAS